MSAVVHPDPVTLAIDKLDDMITNKLAQLTAELDDLRAKQPDTISHVDAVELVASMLLRREGETLTQAVAYERSRNVIQALAGLAVKP